MDNETLRKLIADGESLRVEFKGEARGVTGDREIYETVVCLANAEGGTLLLGVDDNGHVTGAKPRHGLTTDPSKLRAAVFNNTEPRIHTQVSVIPTSHGDVIAIEINRSTEVCATRAGVCVRRVVGVDGPECIPFYPSEHFSRRATLGLVDFSALPARNTTFEDLDPLEFARLRQTVSRLHGDLSLVGLADQELAKALQLVDTTGSELVPNFSGLLLLGRQEVLRRLVPTHEVAFQVLDVHGDVRVNDLIHAPLLAAAEEIQNRFDARLEEEEVIVGMFRLPVPEYGRIAFREAVLNSLLHRDYSQMGTVYLQWHHDHMLISNPGALLEGINLQNILVHEPKPRNGRLYEAAKRIGLVEKTGRGVDKIFHDQLRLGRPAPDYGRTNTTGVRVILQGGMANLEFARFVYEQDNSGQTLKLDDLLVLNKLYYDRHIDSEFAGRLIQKGVTEGRRVLARLHEQGLVEAKGETKGRIYHLSAALYRRLGHPEGFVRIHDIDAIRYEGLVMEFVQASGKITRGELMRLLGISGGQARRVLERMMKSGKIEPQGTPPRWVYYVAKQ